MPKPPPSVQRNARAALEARANASPSNRGMTPVGLARARDLANGRNVSERTLERMVSFLSRHRVDKKGSTWNRKGKGWQAWNGWGGNEAYQWAKSLLGRK